MPALFRRRPRSGPLLLALSLGVNLFLVGWLATQSFSTPKFDKFGVPPEKAAEAIAKTLPDSDGEILRHVISSRATQLNAARRDSQDAMKVLRETIVADPVDQTALRDAFDHMRATRQSERGLFADAIIDAIPQMSLEGRQAFIKTQMGGHH